MSHRVLMTVLLCDPVTSSHHPARSHCLTCMGSIKSLGCALLFQGTIWNHGNSQQLPPFKDEQSKISLRSRPLHLQRQAPE